VFEDLNDDNELNKNDNILYTNALNGKINLVFNQRGRLRFFNDGSARSAGFYICNNNSKETRHIRLLHTGRSRTTDIQTKKQELICLEAKA